MGDPVWLAVAKGLPAGGRTKIACCRADRSMIVNNGNKGYSCHCFRCGDQDFVPHEQWSISDLRRRRAEQEMLTDKVVRLPVDFTLDIPAPHCLFLLKAAVDHVLARQYGIGYSPSVERVIIPIYHKGVLDGYTARSVQGKPKYIERARTPGSLVFIADRAPPLPTAAELGNRYDLVLVEDALSAIRIGRNCTSQVCALMGTSLNPAQSARTVLRDGGRAVAIWLDPDRAGQAAARTIETQLRLQGHDVTVIRSRADPKLLTNREIREHLA